MIITQRNGFNQNPYSYFTQVPGCTLYCDARNPSNNGTLPSNNSTIVTWYDISNNANNLGTSSGSDKGPTFISSHFNGQPALYFNGSQGLYGSGIPICSAPTGSWTIFYVMDMISITYQQFLTDSQGNIARFLIYNNSSKWIWGASGNIGTSRTGKQILTFVLSSSSSTVTAYINSSSIGSNTYAANAPATSLTIGYDYGQSFAPWNGYLGVYLWYNWALDSTTRLNVERALGNAFGIPTG